MSEPMLSRHAAIYMAKTALFGELRRSSLVNLEAFHTD